MDAFSNLDSFADFTDGMRIRLVSRLDPDVVLGVKTATDPSRPGLIFGETAEVQRLSTDDPSTSELTVFTTAPFPRELSPNSVLLLWCTPDGSGYFYPLGFPTERGAPISMVDGVDDFQLRNDEDRRLAMPESTIDFVDGCWFALNNYDRSMVADVYESGTTSGNQIICFPWNGGDNQIWRAQNLDWVPPTSSALKNADTPAVQQARVKVAKSDPATGN